MVSQGWWEGYHYIAHLKSNKNFNPIHRKHWEWPLGSGCVLHSEIMDILKDVKTCLS